MPIRKLVGVTAQSHISFYCSRKNLFKKPFLGGIIHEIAKCMTIAFSLNRTMIFNATNFQYTKRQGFAGILQPFSQNCTTVPVNEVEVKWSGKAY